MRDNLFQDSMDIAFANTRLMWLALVRPVCKFYDRPHKVAQATTQNILIIFLLVGSVVEGAFLDIGEGARPQGMGKAYVGVSDDANALFYNTAGMTQIERISGVSTYTKLYVGIPGLNEGSLGIVLPIGSLGHIGISGTHLNLSDNTAASYAETTVGLSYAYKVNNIEAIGRIMKNNVVSLGIKVKGYNVRYGSNVWTNANPIFGTNSDKVSKWGYGGDFSVYYKSSIEGLRGGISIENVGSPDVGIENESKVAGLIRFGVSYKVLGEVLTSVEVDMRGRAEDNGWMKYNIGSEYWILKEVGIRLGYGIGSGRYNQGSIGFGYRTEVTGMNVGIDYAYVWPFGFIEGLSGTHRISLNIMELEPKKKK